MTASTSPQKDDAQKVLPVVAGADVKKDEATTPPASSDKK
jgi:hypothetical protein